MNFWLRNAPLVKVGNPFSDGIIFVFHLVGCVKRVEKSQSILALLYFSWSRAQFITKVCLWTFVIRFQTMIWPSMRFDVSLKNFKKPLFDIFSPQIERRIFSYNFGCKKESSERSSATSQTAKCPNIPKLHPSGLSPKSWKLMAPKSV